MRIVKNLAGGCNHFFTEKLRGHNTEGIRSVSEQLVQNREITVKLHGFTPDVAAVGSPAVTEYQIGTETAIVGAMSHNICVKQ